LVNYKKKEDKNKKNVIFNPGSITFVERLFNSRKAIFIRKSENCVILLELKK
jgi:predicted phosphodiesterase